MHRYIHLLFVVFGLLFYSCNGQSQKNEEAEKEKVQQEVFEPSKNGCGVLIEFKVDEAYCKKFMLPEVKFLTKAPSQLVTDSPRPGELNHYYNYYLKWDSNKIQTEGINISTYTIARNNMMKDFQTKQLLELVQEFYHKSGFKLREEFLGQENFDGKDYMLYRAIGKINKPQLEFVGEYQILCIARDADVDDKNGLLIMMLANQDSRIKTYKDFADKGCISEVWQNIQFTYE